MTTELKTMLENQNFDFNYDGKPAFSYPNEKVVSEKTQGEKTEYLCRTKFSFGVDAVRTAVYDSEADTLYLRFRLENVSGNYTGTISDLWDFCTLFPLEYVENPRIGYSIDKRQAKLYNYQGAIMTHNDFTPAYTYVYDGWSKVYDNHSGRSSEGLMPYFHLTQGGKGMIFAIGWTGNWTAKMTRTKEGLQVSSGVAGAKFYMEPGETLDLSSALLLSYEGTFAEGSALFRAAMKKRMKEQGHVAGIEDVPFAPSIWGAMTSDRIVKTVEALHKAKMPYTHLWIDAGWYGHSTSCCVNEHEGDWGAQTGSWCVNELYHPDKLQDVKKALKKAGMKLLLWVEPERVIRGTDVTKQHPDWFLTREDDTFLIDYGNEEALNGTIELLSGIIETLGVSCYRQDFNVDPLHHWELADAPGRRGIHQIKHVNGVYRLFDALLEKFPHLTIDNCASGGRRLDFEMCSRSYPLWRDDFNCGFDPDEMTVQNQTAGISDLLPYFGTSIGSFERTIDRYAVRSTYAPMLNHRFFCYENWDAPTEEFLADLKAAYAEYLSVREYLCESYCNLSAPDVKEGAWGCPMETRNVPDETLWNAWQYHKKADDSGIVLLFRRGKSPYPAAEYSLSFVDETAVYEFSDADTNETFALSGKELKNGGLHVSLSEKRSSKLLRYRKK